VTEHDLRYGAFALQGWKLEYTGWDAASAWERTKELAQLTEQLGYHHLWVYDHVETVPRREATHVFEAFTTLAALAQHTTTIKLGQLVTCAAYRNAGLLAKEAACVDVFSGGRLILGLGAGWYEREYQAYGINYPAAGVRLQILDETLEVLKRLWTEETVTFQGKHLSFDGAYCDPKPIQQLPEIWVGGGGEKVTLRIEARHADKTNWQTGIEGFRRKSALLEQYCDEIGAPTAPIAWCSTPRPTCSGGSTRPAAGRCGAGRRTTSTCATTSWGPRSRLARRCRSSSTRDVASSCCGSVTHPDRTVSRRSRVTSSRV